MHNHQDQKKNKVNASGFGSKSKKVFDEQKKQRAALEETMNGTVGNVATLAAYYYDIDSKKISEGQENEDEYPEEDEGKKQDMYTIIKDPQDPKKDLLIYITTEELPEIEHGEKEKDELKRCLQGPLPIFLVHPWTDKGDISKVKKFLDEHAIAYFSPNRGGKIEVRSTEKQKERPIDYTHVNISQDKDAILLLQNDIVKKLFHNPKLFEKFVKKMKILQAYTPEKLYQRSQDSREYNQDEEDVVLHTTIREALVYMSGGDNEKLFNLIHSFNTQKEKFGKTD